MEWVRRAWIWWLVGMKSSLYDATDVSCISCWSFFLNFFIATNFHFFSFSFFFPLLSAISAVRGGRAPPAVWPHRKHVGVWALQEACTGWLSKTPFLWELRDQWGCRHQELGGQPGHQPVTHNPPKTEWWRVYSPFCVEQWELLNKLGPHLSLKHGHLNFSLLWRQSL